MKRKSRLITLIVGFFVFVIPLFFLCDNINKLYEFTKDKVQENLKEKLLNSINKLEENLVPYNYLKSEFDKIHAKLIPDFPQEIVTGIPDNKYINSLYSEKLFEKLKSLTIDEFKPILVIMGTYNLKLFHYLSPELEKQIKETNEKDLEHIPASKAYIDYDIITHIYTGIDYKYNVSHRFPLGENEFRYFTRYISRYRDIKRHLSPIYTDYFGEQTLYPILKGTFSHKGFHGYYSLIIPQRQIDPDSIIKSAITKFDNSINIELIKNPEKENPEIKISEIQKDDNGLWYVLTPPTDFTNHIKEYKILGGDKRDYLLDQKIKISLNYPQELEILEKINSYSYISAFILTLLYIAFSIFFITNKKKPDIKITPKLICILSIILLLPIIGIGLLIWISSQNLNTLIDDNVSKSLHNTIEKHYMLNEENKLRRLSSIFELKRKISNIDLKKDISNTQDEMKFLNNVSKRKKLKQFIKMAETPWFYRWNNDSLYAISEDDKFYTFDKSLGNCFELEKFKKEDRTKNIRYHKYFLSKYFNNLNLLKYFDKKEFNKQLLALSMFEDYMNNKTEEITVGQESIPNRYLTKLTTSNTSLYFYIKDKKNVDYFFQSTISGKEQKPFDYINKYSEKNGALWFKSSNKYHNSNIGIIQKTELKEERNQWPIINISSKEVDDILIKAIKNKDSGNEKINNIDSSVIKEWVFTENSSFIIGGVANTTSYENNLSFSIKMIFPILFSYAILLLLLLTNFISLFINKPVKIYKEAIKKLENNQYGTTIKSFSKDEFDNITKAFNEMSIAIKQKEQIKRYVSDKLVQSVSQNNIQEAGNGKQERVTILSSDIRNFTGISEMHEPSVIVDMLNSYFTKMQQAISKQGGIIDKYIGDAIQAVFYDEPNKENQVLRAAKAAVDMRKALEELNKERTDSGLFTIQNGIGIDTDLAITGTIGTEKGRKDFSVNGDVISRAANLEAKTKQTQSKILLSKKSLEWIATASTKPSNDGLVYKDFDEESVELINVS